MESMQQMRETVGAVEEREQAADPHGLATDWKGEVAAQKIEAVQTQVMDTAQTVGTGFDLRQQIEQRPLLALGAALLGGFLLGRTGGREHRAYLPWRPPTPEQPGYPQPPSPGLPPCSNCGYPNRAPARFCQWCGHQLGDQE